MLISWNGINAAKLGPFIFIKAKIIVSIFRLGTNVFNDTWIAFIPIMDVSDF